jgi:5-(carboxyamino)imidazole ribonucleotide mutase
MNAVDMDESTAKGQVAVVLFASSADEMAGLKPCAAVLEKFGVASAERILQAADCRSLDVLAGVRAAIVASPDGALPSALLASVWGSLPVIRVPVAPEGADAAGRLAALTDGRLGGGYATVALGEAGARNAALLVVSILALNDSRLREAWEAFRREQTEAVLSLPPLD